MPVFEFSCRDCGAQFEELVGSHVGVQIKDVRCPECEGKSLDRKVASFSPTPKQLTANQKRRLEDKRGTDRGGAMARFKKQRATERRHHQRGRGG
jgi:putative FmdB family regulatory protein